jgi:putative ABC transport system ATP-binding protein
MTDSNNTVIEMRGITREYILSKKKNGKTDKEAIVVRALRGVDFTVDIGVFVAIMGPSGSGKSTMMNILGCLDKPSAGTYMIDGIQATSVSEDSLALIRNAKIGFVFQSFNLLPRTSALENVELPLFYRKHNGVRYHRKEIRAMAEESLVEVGMKERLHHYPSQLSGGQQQRVAIARAMVTQSAFILADEPTGNLDSMMTGEVMELFASLNEKGKTIVMVTHEEENTMYCKRVITMRDGLVSNSHMIENRKIPETKI